VVVISPEIEASYESVADEVHRRPHTEGDLEGAYRRSRDGLQEVNAAVAREAKERGIPVNVADDLRRRLRPAHDAPPRRAAGRGLYGGASPTLARKIKDKLEEVFAPEWAGVVEELRRDRRKARRRPTRGSRGR
jgi:siroheme synthase (precorrin-2 oxidase/ferrochelatase)